MKLMTFLKKTNKGIQFEIKWKLWGLEKQCDTFAKEWATWYVYSIPNWIVWIQNKMICLSHTKPNSLNTK